MADLFLHRAALVTGASSGLGREFARQLAARGSSLVLVARSEAALTQLARELSQEFAIDCEVVGADLSTQHGVESLLSALDQRALPIDHVINNAGFGTAGAFSEADAGAETAMIRLHCEAVVRISQHVLPGLVARGFGGILNVASTVGLMPGPYMATYAATKTFLVAFTRALAEELRAGPLRVMVLCPGPVPTGFQERAGTTLGRAELLAALSAEETVRRALIAYEDGMTVYAPGVLNKTIACSAAYAPWWLSSKVFARIMRWLGRARRLPARAGGP